jgi:phosphatidylglycerophosphate synthase
VTTLGWRLFLPIWPALVLGSCFFLGLMWFAARVMRRGFPELPDADRRGATAIATPFLTRYVLWFLTPIERALAAWRIAPTAITMMALFVSAVSGVLAANERLAAAAWLYLGAGMLDILDGRVARRNGMSSEAGAMIDSVVDRWGEFLVLGGAAIYLRGSLAYLLGALAAIAGSQMVSYVRARGESMGLTLTGGTMQRAERVILVSACFLGGAIGKVTGAWDAPFLVAMGLVVVGVAATWTSLHRLRDGVLALQSPSAARVRFSTEASRTARSSSTRTPPKGRKRSTTFQSTTLPAVLPRSSSSSDSMK